MRQPVYGATRGHSPGKAGSSEVGCGMASKARQWQHAGNSAGQMDAAGLMRGGAQPRSRSCAMRSYVARCTEDALSMSPVSMTCLLSFTMLGLCAATSRCGCFGVHGIGHLQTNGLRDVGARGVPSRSHRKWSSCVVRSSITSAASSARRDVTIPHLFLYLRNF